MMNRRAKNFLKKLLTRLRKDGHKPDKFYDSGDSIRLREINGVPISLVVSEDYSRRTRTGETGHLRIVFGAWLRNSPPRQQLPEPKAGFDLERVYAKLVERLQQDSARLKAAADNDAAQQRHAELARRLHAKFPDLEWMSNWRGVYMHVHFTDTEKAERVAEIVIKALRERT